MQNANQELIARFIEEIWNKRHFEKLDEFIHRNFKDHSLPPTLTADKEEMKKWIIGTGTSFEHKTIIEDQVTEGEKSMIKIAMEMTYWKLAEYSAERYRSYRSWLQAL